jgi:glycosyltransferase involved in cell wall biosynthesis
MTLSIQPVAEYRTRYSRWSGLFGALDARYPLLFADPELAGREKVRSYLRHLHPRRSTMMARAAFSGDTFTRRTRHAEDALEAHSGEYDLIFLLQTLFAPGLRHRPFVIYTDTTFARTWEEWPAWAPIGDDAARRFWELEREVSSYADTVFTMSEHARRSFVEEYGCAPERVINVGTAMALPPADLTERSWEQPTALFVGADFPRKGGPELLAAWPRVRESVPSATLVVVGPRVRPGQVPEGVRWLGRIDDRDELARLYRSASLFVLPAHFDPMPWVLGEAMANGLPCLVTPSCGMPEVVSDGITGRVVDRLDPEGLAGEIAELLADPERLERLGRAGYESITRASRWEDVADRMAPRLEQAALPA